MRNLAHTLEAAGVNLIRSAGAIHDLDACRPVTWAARAEDHLHDVEIELERALKAVRAERAMQADLALGRRFLSHYGIPAEAAE